MRRRRPAKGFDSIAFKRKAQAEIYTEIKGLSPREEIAYFRQGAAAGRLGKLWRALGRGTEAQGGSEAPSTETVRPQLAIK